MAKSNVVRPPYDVELGAIISGLPLPGAITVEMIPAVRQGPMSAITVEQVLHGERFSHEEHSVPVEGGNITVSVFRPNRTGSSVGSARSPGVYWIHGGGMVLGTRFLGVSDALEWAEECNAVVVAVEYRLAPENPDPIPVEDCYAGLLWMRDHHDTLGIDLDRLMIAGASAGGGLAAGTALLTRDRDGPRLIAQCLIYPMLDDRCESTSNKQYAADGIWSSASNFMGWTALLGDRRGGSEVSMYAAPARAQSLSGLPTTYIEVCSTETFRDEDVAYASKLWECGVQAELHVWPGGFHASDMMAPTTAISLIQKKTRSAWVYRTLLAK